MFWGVTPALDFIEEYTKHCEDLSEVVNIFILGGSDARHILKTLSCLHKHKRVNINFYLVEPCIELVARELLLLNIALEDDGNLKLEKKTRFFMEVYGNTLVRPAVHKFIKTKAEYLVNYITRDINIPCEDHMKIIDISGLKYKERDYLENLFKFWESNTKTYDLKKFWDDRVRKYLGVRYDSKFGAFDWDLNMKLHQVGANQITIHEYKEFRSTGTSFTWLQNEVSKDNRTFVSGVMPNGDDKYIHRGYLGEIAIGPYIAYGLKCDRKQLMESNYGVNKYRATDVTEYNLKQIFYQIQHGINYKTSVNEDKEDAKITEIIEENDESNVDNLENVKIILLSCFKSLRHLPQSVHVLWISNLMNELFSKELVNTLAPGGALVMFEGIKYNPENRKDTCENYEKKIKGHRQTFGEHLEEITFDASKDDFAKILFKKI